MGWPPRDWRAMVALVFSVIGAVVLTGFLWWGVWMLLPSGQWQRENETHRLETIRWILWITAAAVALIMVGLGMAVNRRSFKGKFAGGEFDLQGGDDPVAAAAKQTADAAQETADQIAEQRTPIPTPQFGGPPM